jgi:hypothetical protein
MQEPSKRCCTLSTVLVSNKRALDNAMYLGAGEMQEPSKRAAESIVKQQDSLVEELTHGHPF